MLKMGRKDRTSPREAEPQPAARIGCTLALSRLVMHTGHMNVNATEFKAKCLALIDRVAKGEEVRITKRGRVVARLVADADSAEKPWLALRGTIVVWHGDPLAPA